MAAYADILRSPTRTRNDEANLIDGLLAAQINGSYLYAGTSGGTANVQTAALTQAPASYANGIAFSFKAGVSNTGSATFNLNSLGAATILDARTGAALIGFEIIINNIYYLEYVGSNFYLMNGSPGVASWTPTITAAAPMTISATSSINCYWVKLGGKIVKYWGTFNATLATTASTVVYLTLPFTLDTSIHQSNACLGSCYFFNGSIDVVGSLSMQSNTQLRVLRYDAANHSLAATAFRFEGSAVTT